MAWPLLAHERTKWSSRSEEYGYRVSCRNLLYVGDSVDVDLHQTALVEVEVDAQGPAGGTARWRGSE